MPAAATETQEGEEEADSDTAVQAQSGWQDQLSFLRELTANRNQKTGEEAFLGNLMLASTRGYVQRCGAEIWT